MQMGPWSLSEGSLYDIDFFEMLPAAARFCGDDSVFSRPGRVAPADQGRRYPLSQVRLFDTIGSC